MDNNTAAFGGGLAMDDRCLVGIEGWGRGGALRRGVGQVWQVWEGVGHVEMQRFGMQ